MIEREVYHLGKVPKQEGIFGVMDRLWDKMGTVLNEAFSVILRRYEGEQRVKQAIERIDFKYLEQLLKKVVQNSAIATKTEYTDFTISKDSVTCDDSIEGKAQADIYGYLKIDQTYFGKWAKEFTDDNLMLAMAVIITHEAIHLLAMKENRQSGFTQGLNFTSLNEAMTELLARAIGSAYGDFTTTINRENWLSFSEYSEDMKYLLALMAIIARDNQISIDVVIQAFTASYFCDNSVVDSVSQFTNISEDAKSILEKLKAQKGNESTFDITQFNFDAETKSFIEDVIDGKRRNKVVRSALHL